MTEQKEKEFAKDVEIEVNKIEMSQGKEQEIVKVTFVTNKGKVTWKPKVEEVEMVRGIEIKKTVPASFDKLPQRLFDIQNEINSKGVAKVKASYSIWNTTVDNEPVTYRFILGTKMFESWELVKEDTQPEQVQ